jgi:hypothetical protein
MAYKRELCVCVSNFSYESWSMLNSTDELPMKFQVRLYPKPKLVLPILYRTFLYFEMLTLAGKLIDLAPSF